MITVGSVTRSRRFSAQLADAVLSLHVGPPTDPTAQMGPVVEQPGQKLRAGLTELGDGEAWLSRPRLLDEGGTLFSPGVRTGVEEGSAFHLTEYFGPVLGVIHADTLEDAVRMQNGTDYGLTAGLHSLEPSEIAWWTEHVEAGNLYVNRGITGAIVQRQPFGGWKRSAIGQTAKAGGPNYLVHLMDWADGAAVPDRQSDPETWAAAARHSDREHFSVTFAPRDVQDLHGEINVLRYLPLPVMVRAAEGSSPHELERVLHAAATANAAVEVSAASRDSAEAARASLGAEASVTVEDAAAFASRVPSLPQSRVRLIGAVDPQLRTAIAENIEVALFTGEVVASGRVELLPFLREQAISATNHRYGNPLPQPLDLTGGRGFSRGRA